MREGRAVAAWSTFLDRVLDKGIVIGDSSIGRVTQAAKDYNPARIAAKQSLDESVALRCHWR